MEPAATLHSTAAPTPHAEHLTVPRTARIWTLGSPNDRIEEVWFVLHGYGQLAEYFVRYFLPIADGTRYFVAPEGLSRFYLDPQYSRVGASWMTREDRQLEIADQHTYLNALYDRVMLEFDPAQVRVNVLGFSQGTATAFRWVETGHPKCDNLIAWGGALPLDPAANGARHAAFERKEIIMAFGSDDPITTPERIAQHRAELERAGILYEVFQYEGGHTIPEEAIVELGEQLRSEALARR